VTGYTRSIRAEPGGKIVKQLESILKFWKEEYTDALVQGLNAPNEESKWFWCGKAQGLVALLAALPISGKEGQKLLRRAELEARAAVDIHTQ
jgi:hypothetical protein